VTLFEDRKYINIMHEQFAEHGTDDGAICMFGKIERCPAARHAGPNEEREYSSYSFLTSALDEVSGLHHTPAVLYLWVKDLGCPLDRRLGEPHR
jgi:hypothetical protein